MRARNFSVSTGRTDLDDRISKTFRATGHEPKRAATGENLLSLIEDKTPVVTTLIHKFRAGLNKRRVVDKEATLRIAINRFDIDSGQFLNLLCRQNLPWKRGSRPGCRLCLGDFSGGRRNRYPFAISGLL